LVGELVAVERDALRAMAVGDEIVVGIDEVEAVGKKELHAAFLPKLLRWSSRASWSERSRMSRPATWRSFQSRPMSVHRPEVQWQCTAIGDSASIANWRASLREQRDMTRSMRKPIATMPVECIRRLSVGGRPQ